jgi:hypothetical protein
MRANSSGSAASQVTVACCRWLAAAALRDDALATEPARLREDLRTVALQVLTELQAIRCTGDERLEALLAFLELTRPPILAVELEEIERIEEHFGVVGAAMELLEYCDAGLTAADRLAIDHYRYSPFFWQPICCRRASIQTVIKLICGRDLRVREGGC